MFTSAPPDEKRKGGGEGVKKKTRRVEGGDKERVGQSGLKM